MDARFGVVGQGKRFLSLSVPRFDGPTEKFYPVSTMLVFLLALSFPMSANVLPSLSLNDGPWQSSEGVTITEGVATIKGSPVGYNRAILEIDGKRLAGKSIRFLAQVKTSDMKQGKDIPYASPKLKIIDPKGARVMAVNNFGTENRSEWQEEYVNLQIPKDHEDPIVFELGVQLCSGTLQVKDVKMIEVEPWRWRVLDAGHKSYFDK